MTKTCTPKLQSLTKPGIKAFKPAGPTTAPKEEVIEVRINPMDIEHAVQGNANSCAIARGFKRVCNDDKAKVSVCGSSLTYSGPHGKFSASLPPEVVAWYGRFDGSKSNVKPFYLRIVGNGENRRCEIDPEVSKELKAAMAH